MNNKTIFIETKNVTNNIEIFFELSFFLERPMFSFWFYPETSHKDREKMAKAFKKFYSNEMLLERVTTYYDDADKFKNNTLYLLNDASRILIIELFQVLSSFCDSIIVYADNSTKWKLCNIFHENLLLIKDDAINEKIFKDHAIQYSFSAPEWW